MAAAIVLGILLSAPSAWASSVSDEGYYTLVTSAAYSNLPSCLSTYCTNDGTGSINKGAQVYTSDYSVAQMVAITGAQNGDVYQWQAISPNGTTDTLVTVTYNAGCFTWAGGSVCPATGNAEIMWDGVSLLCQPTGQWTIQVTDNGVMGVSHYWDLTHGGMLDITSPTENELFDLDQQNYTATSTVPYVADTTTGNAISWAVALSYATSGGYGATLDTLPSFGTTGGEEHDETYQSKGGQVQAEASTTASDGSTISDCVTFYVDGVQSPSPLDPTTQLLNLYSTGATPHLMTGLATHESGYSQFNYPGGGSPHQPDLYNGVQGLWPYESGDGGSHIGLMMVPTTESDAWDWTQNTNDGVNSTTYGFVGEKLPTALLLSEWLTGAKKNKVIPIHQGLPALSPTQLEDMALVLYGPAAAGDWSQQYYVPVCPPPGTISAKGNTWICNGANWYWTPNDPDLSDPGADQNVQAQYIFAAGTSGPIGNRPGLQYVTNVSADPWYDGLLQPGVRNQMK